MKSAKTAWNVGRGALAAVLDLVKTALAIQSLKNTLDTLPFAVVTEVMGIEVPGLSLEKVDDLKNMAYGAVAALQDPPRVLAALGQKIGDTVEEEGIAYSISYVAADVAIQVLLSKGLGEVKNVSKADDLVDVARTVDTLDDTVKIAGELTDAAKVVDKVDDITDVAMAVNVVDETNAAVKTVDKVGGVVEHSDTSLINIDEIRPKLKTEPNTAYFWSGRTDGIGGADVAADIAKSRGGVTLESTIKTQEIIMPEWDFNNPSTMEAWDLASGAYAEQVSGDIHAVIGTKLRDGNIWENVELPRLRNNPNVTKITIIDPKTGAEKIIFER